MNLLYNNINLGTLGVLQMMGSSTEREPRESPQRERVTVHVRLDFFENSFVDNASLISQVRAALKTQHAQLIWSDANGSQYLNRTVIAGLDDEPADGRALSGTTRQALSFHFTYYNHDVATNCLQATFQSQAMPSAPGQPPGAAGATITLGNVEKWSEKVDVELFNKMRAQRKTVMGTVTASGRYQADTTQSLGSRQQSLMQAKDAMKAAITASELGIFKFGTFNQSVKLTNFNAAVDQPANFIEWQLTATYTIYPIETDYIIAEYEISNRIVAVDGIVRLGIRGTIGAPTAALARNKLNLLLGSIVPQGYVQEVIHLTDNQAESNQPVAGGGDGLAYIELRFEVEYRDTTTLTLQYQSMMNGTPNSSPVLLGTVERFSDQYQADLFDPLRPHRRRAGGMISAAGRIYASDSLTLADKRTYLAGIKTAMDAALVVGDNGTLIYTGFFNGNVRLIGWNCEVDRANNSVGWTLSCQYTRFPDETDYALCDFTATVREDKEGGTVHFLLTGRIGAPSYTAAFGKLIRLRAAYVPAGYVLKAENNQARNVSVESKLSSGTNKGDGDTFIELSFNDDWQQPVGGNVMNYTLRIDTDDDAKSGYVIYKYSGQVTAYGVSTNAAVATATAQAQSLGGGIYPMMIRNQIVANERSFVTTGGNFFATVDYMFEYQARGGRTFIELNSTIQMDAFAPDRETVSGYVTAPTLALANAAYLAQVRGLATYAQALIMNESFATIASESLSDPAINGGAYYAEDKRFPFSFTVHRIKSSGQTSLRYTVTSRNNYLANEIRTNVRGIIQASDEQTARNTLAVYLQGLNFGNLAEEDPGTVTYDRAAGGNGSQVQVFKGLEFSASFVNILQGANAVLESEVSERIVYSGPRNVEQKLPDGPSIIQQPGTTLGRQTITAMCKATTESAASQYLQLCQALLLAGGFREPTQVETRFMNLELSGGVPRTPQAKVKVCVKTVTFTVLIPSLTFGVP